MLQSLLIRNYALIDELDISFDEGLSILTGETGAGKSIILGALSLILGKRADTSVLMDEDKKCIIEVSFDVNAYKLKSVFESLQMEYDSITVIRREISSNGKSRAFVNDSPVNLVDLRELVNHLIDIHSQHETLALNTNEYQLSALDYFAGTSAEVEEFGKGFNELTNIRQKLDKLKRNLQTSNEQQDYLNHLFEELNSANLNIEEEVELQEELKTLTHMEEVKESLQTAILSLSNEDNDALSSLETAEYNVSKAAKFVEKLEENSKRISSVRIELSDILSELEDLQQSMTYDPERHQIVQDRLNLIQSLEYKHKVGSVKELLEIAEELNDKLGGSIDTTLEISKLEKQHQELKSKLVERASNISRSRSDVKGHLESAISELLVQLNMKGGNFELLIRPKEIMDETGADDVEFMFSANKGVPAKEIGKIASGGELSRLMLSLKSVMAKKLALPSIVFDEIDSGISGEVADKTGLIIRNLSANTQVICITHLPQMASKGNAHYLVYKDQSTTPPKTKIRKLSQEERIREIAKMLSGESLTEQAIENAKVLLND